MTIVRLGIKKWNLKSNIKSQTQINNNNKIKRKLLLEREKKTLRGKNETTRLVRLFISRFCAAVLFRILSPISTER